jgi:hypothetical protein
LNTNGFNYQSTNSGSWAISSDERIKNNIEEADYDICYNNIDKLALKRYSYIDGIKCINCVDKHKLGFIAQEVKLFYPKNVTIKAVTISNDITASGTLSSTQEIEDCLSIDIEQIQMTLYGAVKKIISINKANSLRIQDLENKIQKLEVIARSQESYIYKS